VGRGMSHRLLFSSRDVPQISRLLSKKEILSLSDEKLVIDLAMRSYVNVGITRIRSQFHNYVDQVSLNEIESELVDKADGMDGAV
jgi:hypothetical protein